MAKEFDLETILTITTGITLVDDFNKVFNLAQFVYNDEYLNTTGLQFLKYDLKDYILSCYPELKNVIPPMTYSISFPTMWLEAQKQKFSSSLELTPKVKDAILKR